MTQGPVQEYGATPSDVDKRPAEPGQESGEPVTEADRRPGAGSRLPAQGGGENLMERDGEIVGVPGRADGADLTSEDARGSGLAGGGGA